MVNSIIITNNSDTYVNSGNSRNFLPAILVIFTDATVNDAFLLLHR